MKKNNSLKAFFETMPTEVRIAIVAWIIIEAILIF